MKRHPEPQPIQNILHRLVKQLPESPGSRLLQINVLWQQVAGKIIGDQSRVVRLDQRGTLHILLMNKIWLDPLIASRNHIIQRLNTLAGGVVEIHELSFRAEPVERRHDRNGKRPVPAAEISSEVLEAASAIEDEQLRAAFLKACRALSTPRDQAGSGSKI